MSDNDLIRRGDVLGIVKRIRSKPVKRDGSKAIDIQIEDALRNLPAAPRAEPTIEEIREENGTISAHYIKLLPGKADHAKEPAPGVYSYCRADGTVVGVKIHQFSDPRAEAAIALAEKFCTAMRFKRSGVNDRVAMDEAMRQLRVSENAYLAALAKWREATA